MYSYLQDRFQRVKYKGVFSERRPITSGVPQGSLLGPYLFVIYCHDLRPAHEDTFMLQYADDICQVINVKNK